MTPPVADVAASFPAKPGSAGLVRRFLRSELHRLGVPGPSLDDALLLTSELVSNVVLHARTDMTVRLSLESDCLRVEVADGNCCGPTTMAAPIDAISGRGIQVVASVADNWGVEGTLQGKIVWFELLMAGWCSRVRS